MQDAATDRNYYRRKMSGITASEPVIQQIDRPLSELLKTAQFSGRLMLCGSMHDMSRAYMDEPVKSGAWVFARPILFENRSAVYRPALRESCEHPTPRRESPLGLGQCKACNDVSDQIRAGEHDIRVQLARESWLPGCEDAALAVLAWEALREEWSKHTKIPLLNTPSKTGQAFLWENFPAKCDLPALDEGLAVYLHANIPQHRLEMLRRGVTAPFGYDGRWMYAGCALANDRLPVGEARRVGHFEPYQPGLYRVAVTIPSTWKHIGLLPMQTERNGKKAWWYPNTPGATIPVTVMEPELTLAIQQGWEIVDFYDGWAWDKGRPLQNWARKLIEMREAIARRRDGVRAKNERQAQAFDYAYDAIREILNHTIGSLHADTFQREGVVSAATYREMIEKHGYSRVRTLETMRGGKRRIIYPAKHQDKLSIFLPHISGTVWSLERAMIAKHALMCDYDHLVEIRGDAIYSTSLLDLPDNGHYGQLRRKGV